MQLKLTINCDSVPFTQNDTPGPELARIFKDLLSRIQKLPAHYFEDGYSQPIFNADGDECGHWHIEDKK